MSSTGKRGNYHGVRCKEGSWVSEIRVPGERGKKSRIWLGTFLTPEMAAIAHDVAARILQGEGAIINFPANLQHYPMPGSLSLADIPAAAVSISKLMGANSVEGSRQLVVAGLHGGGERNGSGGAGGGGGGAVGGGDVGDGGIALPFGPEVYIDEEAGLHGGGESNGGGGAGGGGGGAVGGGGVGGGGIALPFGPEVYIDEEAIFNMHHLLTDMADGLLMNRWHMPYSDD